MPAATSGGGAHEHGARIGTMNRRLWVESRHLHAAPTNGVVRHEPIGLGSLWERNEFGLVAGHLREAAFLPVLLGLLDPIL
jgi:hypothetical protein